VDDRNAAQDASGPSQAVRKGFAPAFGAVLLGLAAQVLLDLARRGEYLPPTHWLLSTGPWVALALYVVAAALAALASRRTQQAGDALPAPEAQSVPYRARELAPAILAIAAGILAMVVRSGHSAPVAAWALAGLALAGVLGSIWLGRNRPGPGGAPRSRVALAELFAITLILLAATALRAHLLDRMPSGIFFDEAQNGMDALQILEEGTHPVWSDSLSGRPTLHLHLLAGAFRLLGVRVFPMRLVSIVLGVLAIAAVYRLGRSLLGGRAALLAAAFLALSRFHLHYSRLVFEAAMTPFLITMALFFLWRATRRGRWWDYVLCAAMMAAGLYTYVSFRLLPLVLVLFCVHLVFSERGFLRRNLPGLLLCVATLALLLVPLGRFAWSNPERFLNRLNEVSLAAEVRETGSWRPVLKNVVGYLTMYNYRGDQNNIMNLPGEPGFGLIAGVFLVLGAGICLARWRDPRYAGLLLWFGAGLLPGALTHSIETPHSTRVIASLPAACLMAGLALRELWRAVLQLADAGASARRARRWRCASAGVVAAILLAAGVADYQAYFVRQARHPGVYAGFEPAANRIGRLIEAWGPRYQVLVSPGLMHVFPEDTVLCFVAHNAAEYEALDYVAHIPYKGPAANRGVAYILEARYQVVLPILRQWYPQGVLETHHNQFGGALFYTFRITPDEVLAARGLEGSYYAGAGEAPILARRELREGFTWRADPSPAPPWRVVWRGSLYVPAYGRYAFDLEGPGEAKLTLNGEAVAWGQESVLPKGLHALTLEYAVGSAGETLSLYWRGTGLERQVVPAEALYALEASPHGLEAAYYRKPDWTGPPAAIQLDPLIFSNCFLLEGMFGIIWRGQVFAPQEGAYLLGAESDDGSRLYIDGDLVVDNGGAHGEMYVEGTVRLAQGWHDIEVKYAQEGGGMSLTLYWQPPGGQRERLPESHLRYPIAQWGVEDVAQAAQPAPPAPLPPSSAEMQPFTLGPLVVQWGKEGSRPGEFSQPRGLGVDSQGRVYVADSGNARVQVFDGEGRFLASWDEADRPFEVPWDIAVTAQDEVLVLDAGPNWIYRFSAKGKYLGKFGGPEAQLYQPRGLSLDAEGNIYVADTGGHRLVAFDAAGQLIGALGSQGSGRGQLLEPTDVGLDAAGETFVVDNSNRRIQRWDRFGAYVGEWSIPVANAYNGPHLAMLPDGSFFITTPELNEIWRYSPSGELLGQWGGTGEFRVPTDLALDGDKYLYVADTLQHQVHKYELVLRP